MKKIMLYLEMAAAFVLMFTAAFLYLITTDSSGRDLLINLHEGYMIESANSEEQSLVRWTKEGEENNSLEPAAVILEGRFTKYYADEDFIAIYDERGRLITALTEKRKPLSLSILTKRKLTIFCRKNMERIISIGRNCDGKTAVSTKNSSGYHSDTFYPCFLSLYSAAI